MEPRADNGVSRRGAIGGRTGKCARVEPGIGSSLVEAGRDALDGVGTRPQGVIVPCISTLGNIERATASQSCDAAEGPAAEDKALGAFPGFREGNFPNVAQHEPVALIIKTGCAFGLTAAARTLADAAAGVDGFSGVVNGFRPGVSGGQAQALREAMLKTALEGVINGVGVGG